MTTPKKPPATEVRAERRRFTAAYRQRILAEADALTEPGALGALLRREGLYSSHLSKVAGHGRPRRRHPAGGSEAGSQAQHQGPRERDAGAREPPARGDAGARREDHRNPKKKSEMLGIELQPVPPETDS